MRSRSAEIRPGTHAPEPVYSPTETITATVLLSATLVVVLLAASSPAAAAVLVAAAIVAYRAGLTLRRRRRSGRTKCICIPRLDVCIGM